MNKISVIVPVYNVEEYLDKCLNSLVNQTLKDIEIIIVNDGSPDNSEKIIKEYENKYPKMIKSVYQENGGLSSARNMGLSKANGDYISFIDSDDWIELDMLETMYNFAIKNDYDIVCCNTLMVYDNGNSKEVKANFELSEDYKDFMLAPPMACNKIYKRSLFDDIYKFKVGIFYEDLELIPSLIIKTNKIGYIDMPYYNYYQRSGSISYQTKFNTKILDIFKVLNSLEEKFQKNNLLEEYYTELEYLYIEHLLYSTALRLSVYGNESKKYFKQITDLINERYPNWQSNKYFKRKSIKFKIVCKLGYHRRYKLIKILSNIKK